MANDSSKVTFGKPKVGGAIYWAPSGSTLPTDTETALDNAFVCLGYVSEDGIQNSNSPSTENKKAYGGDIVAVLTTERKNTYKYTLIEALNVDVLKAIYGTGNVTGTMAAGATVRHNSADVPASCWVIDQVLSGTAQRIVIPAGKLSDLGEIKYADKELVGYEVTITALPGDSSFDFDNAKTYYKE